MTDEQTNSLRTMRRIRRRWQRRAVWSGSVLVPISTTHAVDTPIPDLSGDRPCVVHELWIERLHDGCPERINWLPAFFLVLSVPLLGLCFHATRLGFSGPKDGERGPTRA